jgi:hypothetical protein
VVRLMLVYILCVMVSPASAATACESRYVNGHLVEVCVDDAGGSRVCESRYVNGHLVEVCQ